MSTRETRFRLLLVAVLVFAAAGLHAQISVAGSLTHRQTTAPAAHYTGTIRVRNDGEEAVTVRLSQTDYRFQHDGRVFYDEPGSQARSNAAWIDLPAAAVRVPARTEVPVNYLVRVPEGDDLFGTYWSIIMVESDLSGAADASEGVGVRHVMRFGVQVISELPGGEGELATVAASLEHGETDAELLLGIANTGTRMLRPTVSVELYARDGSQLGPYGADAQRLYPDTSALFRVALAGVPHGEYRAVAIIDAGGDDVYAARYNLEIK